MNEKRDKRGGAGCAVMLVLLLLIHVLPVLYVLSLGPVSWFVHNGYMSSDTWEKIYAPVLWVSVRYGSFGKVVVWYVDIFRPA